MTREEKASIIGELSEKFSATDYFYITDASGMTVEQVNKFRRLCFDRGIEYRVIKNTLIRKAIEQSNKADVDYSLFNKTALKGFSGVLFTSEAGNAPARLLKEYYKGGLSKPVFKGASVDSTLYIGADQLDFLENIKSRQELIGDIVTILQSPAKNVVSALQSGGGKLAGILKTLSEKAS
jgi:large subunit ribosomal protein L10